MESGSGSDAISRDEPDANRPSGVAGGGFAMTTTIEVGRGAPPPGGATGGGGFPELYAVALASLRDLQWRTKRFVMAALATGLVLGLALLMSGISNSFSVEIHNTVESLDAQSWLVSAGSPGPFTAPSFFPLGELLLAWATPGVRRVSPLLVGHALESFPGEPVSKDKVLNLLGVAPGGIGNPTPAGGSRLADDDDGIVVDSSTGLTVGRVATLDGSRFKVIGVVHGITYFAGQPVVFMAIGTADRLVADGQPVASALLVDGIPARSVPGFTVMTPDQVMNDLRRPIAQAIQTIKLIEVLLWLVAAGIIGAIVYLSAVERRVDFAVQKALGTPNWQIFVGLVVQAVAMSVGAAVISFAIEAAVAPTSAMAVRLSGADYAAVPILAVVVGVVASLIPTRSAAKVDPALAFGGAK